MHMEVAGLRSCAIQAAAASARKEVAAIAAAAEERAQVADLSAASLRARIDQEGTELASAITSGQESAKVLRALCVTCAISSACSLAFLSCRCADIAVEFKEMTCVWRMVTQRAESTT